MTLEERVGRFTADKSLLDGVHRLGLAVSGGSDSLALLHLVAPLCRAMGVETAVLTFDHAIPGEHSDVDAAFVRDESARLGLPFFGERASGIAAGGGRSLEMAARAARQAFYRRAVAQLGLDAIATGHQADDVAETLLLRLLRGAGAAGLSGLRPRSTLPPAVSGDAPLVLIRPLLAVRRKELRAWLRERGLRWCEDPSNANEAIARNEVRRSILPALARRSGGLDATILQLAQSADILREEDAFLEGLAAAWLASSPADGGLPLTRLRAEQPPALQRRIARLWLLEHAGAEATGYASVERVLGLADGAVTTLSGGSRVACAAGRLCVMDESSSPLVPAPLPLPVPGVVEWGNFVVTTSLGGSTVKTRTALDVWPAVCTLSTARVGGGGLLVRGRRPGDRIDPFGLSGTKKLQDVFTDGKVPLGQRDGYPLVVRDGEVVWVPGYRIAAPYAVRNGEECLRITIAKRA